jgi:hypothetical protein
MTDVLDEYKKSLLGTAIGREHTSQFDRKLLAGGVDGEMLNQTFVAPTSNQTDKGGQTDRMFPLVGFRQSQFGTTAADDVAGRPPKQSCCTWAPFKNAASAIDGQVCIGQQM